MAGERKNMIRRRIGTIILIFGAGLACCAALLAGFMFPVLSKIPAEPPKIDAGTATTALWGGGAGGSGRQEEGATNATLAASDGTSRSLPPSSGALRYPPFLPDSGLPEQLRQVRDELNRRFDGLRAMIAAYEADKEGMSADAIESRIRAIQAAHEEAWAAIGRSLGHGPDFDDPFGRELIMKNRGFDVWLNGARSECEERAGNFEEAGQWMSIANRIDETTLRIHAIEGGESDDPALDAGEPKREEANWEREAALLRKAGPAGWAHLVFRSVARQMESFRREQIARKKQD